MIDSHRCDYPLLAVADGGFARKVNLGVGKHGGSALQTPGMGGDMSVTITGARIGAVGFALGLSLAGLAAAGVASADTPDTGSAPAAASPANAATAAKSRPTRSAKTEKRAATGSVADGRRSDLPASRIGHFLAGGPPLARRSVSPAPTAASAADSSALPVLDPTPPSITVHNNTAQTIWIYNLTNSGDYSIPADFQPVSIGVGDSAPVTLAIGTGAAGSPRNRIYVVEGPTGFTLPVAASSGVDAFNPTAVSAENSFLNYNFLEYNYYPANGSYDYTIDTSYIDEWSLPTQMKFTLNGSNWSGAVDGQTYGFNDFDTVASQLAAAGGPYSDLVWSGSTPWTPQPPATVSRIIGPDKVWTQQSFEPAENINMNNTGWVPVSYQDFVQFGSYPSKDAQSTVYPYAQDGTAYSTIGNFNFWKFQVTAPASTPYPIALRTAAILDKFPADSNGVYGFFTYPNDEAAGQFTNIPEAVSLDIYVNGSADGVSDSVVKGGAWLYSRPAASGTKRFRTRGPGGAMNGTSATDTFILNYSFERKGDAPQVDTGGEGGDIVVIDKAAIAGATSSVVETVDTAQFHGCDTYASQFVYESSTGYLYYDRDPSRPGYTGVLAKLSLLSPDQTQPLFIL